MNDESISPSSIHCFEGSESSPARTVVCKSYPITASTGTILESTSFMAFVQPLEGRINHITAIPRLHVIAYAVKHGCKCVDSNRTLLQDKYIQIQFMSDFQLITPRDSLQVSSI